MEFLNVGGLKNGLLIIECIENGDIDYDFFSLKDRFKLSK